MSSEEKSKYFSKRVRIADVTSPKDFVGYKEMTIELVFGNQDVIIIKNKDDVAEVLDEKGIFDEIEEIYKQRDKWVAELHPDFRFMDQIKPKKYDSFEDLVKK